jgi:orotate phosphoribosyltransferase
VSLDSLATRVAERALLRGQFVLRSGKRSTVYLDKYRFETDPGLLREIGAALAALARQRGGSFELLAGPELGAVPLVAALSLELDVPFVIVRKAAKGYGTEKRLEGVYEDGQSVLLVEDVVTSGGAAISAVEGLRESGLEVDTALCVLDRGEGGSEALAAAGVTLHPLFDRTALGLDVA